MSKDVLTMRHTTLGFLVALAFALLAAMPSADAQHVVFLMRHAERTSGADADDPPLTETGQRRAKALVTVLKDSGITAIDTSAAQRTIQTAMPLAQALQIESKSMSRRDIDGLLERLRTQHADGRVLIISPSLPIPHLLKALGHPEEVMIERTEYDRLFMVVPKPTGPPLVFVVRFSGG